MIGDPLTEREQLVLEAVIRTYVDTAEPAGSRTVVRRFNLGISPAMGVSTMSDLEEKGYLFHPHTSAGRMPTDRAYRVYVDSLLEQPRDPFDAKPLRAQLTPGADRTGVELVIRRAAQVLGLLTNELGIAMAPPVEDVVLERLELLSVADGKVLLVMTLRAGGVRTVFVDVPAQVPASTLLAVAEVLNERLAGLKLREVRTSLGPRLRDTGSDPTTSELLNIFVQSAEEWLQWADSPESVHLGRASVLAEQPEFQSGSRLRNLIELTERTDLLKSFLAGRLGGRGLNISIGAEHSDPALADFTVVTSEYQVGNLRGVIGVIGPTRMPYARVIGLVESTSALISEFLT